MLSTLLRLALAALLALVLLPGASLAQAPDEPLLRLEVAGSPLLPGQGKSLPLTVSLARPADLRLRAVDFDGSTVRVLFDGRRRAGRLEREWFGRDEDGQQLPHGPYRVVATATTDEGTGRASTWITISDRRVYPEAPGFITVAVDPGHGGEFDGAVGPDGTREADLNLDIGLRLARMLEGAGVNVVVTRTRDGLVNEPPEDRTGDRVIDGDDELAARPDLANGARADLFISIHNNNAVNTSVGGPSTFFYDERPYSGRSARLARIVQEEMVEGLADAVDGTWEPYDHGALVYPYYLLRGYDPPRLRRPTQMPAVLSEGMFLSNPRELALLKRPAIRGAMAAAYYQAVSRYLARRGAHVGYELVAGPTEPVEPGSKQTLAVEVRNQGTEPIRDWRLDAEVQKAPPRYVGRVGRGTPAGEARIPRLMPGEVRTVKLKVALPEQPGDWMVVVDSRDGGGRRAAGMGAPALQVRLSTLEPAVPTATEEPAAP